jgi:tripartite-type tricarboxylate transporter receptor subunit TctC
MNDLLTGRVAAYFSTYSTAQPHIESGKLVALATTGLTRPSFLPQLPTVAESGLPGFAATNWYAFVGPAKLPAVLLDRWNQELVKVLTTPDELLKHGLIAAPGSREELGRFIESESRTWGRVIVERRITVE